MKEVVTNDFNQYVPLIKSNPLFNGIAEEELPNVLRCLRPFERRYKKSELIVRANDVFEGIGLLLKGKLLITKETAIGERNIISILNPGELFGDLAAFTSSHIWPSNVEANSECHVVFIKTQAITGMCCNSCKNHQLIILNMLRIISERLYKLELKVDFLSKKTMRGKLCNYIFEQYKQNGKSMMFLLPLNQSELADYLYVSRSSMCRELGRMRDENIIDFQQSSIKILDLNRLKLYASY